MTTLEVAVKEYVALRRSAGFVMRYESALLPQFVAFLRRRKARLITNALALEFAMLPQNVQRTHWGSRLSIVRGFARYRFAEDPRTQVPPPYMLPCRQLRRTPTIISDDAFERILAAARALSSTVGVRPHTYSTIFALLAATGMRPGETVRLADGDVDLTLQVITVRLSKGRTRLVPIHASTARALARYRATRRRLVPRPIDDTFFVGDSGRALCRVFLDTTFRNLRRKLAPHADGMRLHDFRHRFAIRTLEDWYRDNKPIEPRMEALSTYLGHTHPRHTYWYLTATPELLRQAQRRLRNLVDLRP